MTTTSYRAVQVSKPGRLDVVERELTAPPPGKVRIRVEACGVCHSDSATVDGTFPGVTYPRVPGHEAVGRIDALGDGVQAGRSVSAWVSDFSPARAVTANTAAP